MFRGNAMAGLVFILGWLMLVLEFCPVEGWNWDFPWWIWVFVSVVGFYGWVLWMDTSLRNRKIHPLG